MSCQGLLVLGCKVSTLFYFFLTNCTHEFWANLMLFHGILQNIIPIVMKSTSKIIKLDGVDIVYLFDEVGYFVGLPV